MQAIVNWASLKERQAQRLTSPSACVWHAAAAVRVAVLVAECAWASSEWLCSADAVVAAAAAAEDEVEAGAE